MVLMILAAGGWCVFAMQCSIWWSVSRHSRTASQKSKNRHTTHSSALACTLVVSILAMVIMMAMMVTLTMMVIMMAIMVTMIVTMCLMDA